MLTTCSERERAVWPLPEQKVAPLFKQVIAVVEDAMDIERGDASICRVV